MRLTASDSALQGYSEMLVIVAEDWRTDFDNSGSVDGQDFLIWQQGYSYGH